MADIAKLVIEIDVKNADKLTSAISLIDKLKASAQGASVAMSKLTEEEYSAALRSEKLAQAQIKTALDTQKLTDAQIKAASATAKLTLDQQKLTSTANSSGDSVKKTTRNWSDFFANMLNAREGAAGLLGNLLRFGTGAYLLQRSIGTIVGMIVQLTTALFKAGASYEAFGINLTALTGSISASSIALGQIQTLVRERGLDLGITQETIAKLKGFGVETKNLVPLMEKFSVATRGDSAAMSRLALVYGQVRQQGRAYGDDIRQIVNTGVPLANALSEALGVPVERLRVFAKEGSITSDVISQALDSITESGSALRTAFDRLSEDSAQGRWSRTFASMKQWFSSIMISFAQSTTGVAKFTEGLYTAKYQLSELNRLMNAPAYQYEGIDIEAALEGAKRNVEDVKKVLEYNYRQLQEKNPQLLGKTFEDMYSLYPGMASDYESAKRERAYIEAIIRRMQEEVGKEQELKIEPKPWKEFENLSDAAIAKFLKTSLESFQEAQLSLLGGDSSKLTEIVNNLVATDPEWKKATAQASVGDEAAIKKLYTQLYTMLGDEFSNLISIPSERIISGDIFKWSKEFPTTVAKGQTDRATAELVAMMSNIQEIMDSLKTPKGKTFSDLLLKYQKDISEEYANLEIDPNYNDKMYEAYVSFVRNIKALSIEKRWTPEQLQEALVKAVQEAENLSAPTTNTSAKPDEYKYTLQFLRDAYDTSVLGATKKELNALKEQALMAKESFGAASYEFLYFNEVLIKTKENVELMNEALYMTKGSVTGARLIVQYFEQLKTTMETTGTEGIIAFLDTVSGTDTNALNTFVSDLIRSLPRLFIGAGLRFIIEGTTPADRYIGLFLLALGGVSYVAAMNLTGASSKISYTTGEAQTVYNAKGNVYSSPSINSLSGRVYNSPTFFKFARGGVLGEAGYEAVLPLGRTMNNKLGVYAIGGNTASKIDIQIINNSSAKVTSTTSEITTANGDKVIRAYLKDAVKSEVTQMGSSGELNQVSSLSKGRRRV